jgi:uncharacterized protein YutE (UPF0331/DUF86 family)
MDEVVVAQKLESLRRCTERIESKFPSSLSALLGDVDLAMHRIASSGSPVPQTMGQAFDSLAQQKVISDALAIRMRRAVGFRNIAVHSYENIDWAVVYVIVKEHLNDFREFSNSVR